MVLIFNHCDFTSIRGLQLISTQKMRYNQYLLKLIFSLKLFQLLVLYFCILNLSIIELHGTKFFRKKLAIQLKLRRINDCD